MHAPPGDPVYLWAAPLVSAAKASLVNRVSCSYPAPWRFKLYRAVGSAWLSSMAATHPQAARCSTRRTSRHAAGVAATRFSRGRKAAPLGWDTTAGSGRPMCSSAQPSCRRGQDWPSIASGPRRGPREPRTWLASPRTEAVGDTPMDIAAVHPPLTSMDAAKSGGEARPTATPVPRGVGVPSLCSRCLLLSD